MNWKYKNRLYRILSSIPGGQAFYKFSQKYLTRSLAPNVGRIESKARVALRYWESIRRLGLESDARSGLHIDFGTGWHPTIPFVFHALGVQRQYLLDLSPVLDPNLVSEGLAILSEIGPDLFNSAGLTAEVKNSFSPRSGKICDILDGFGIEYHAPYSNFLSELKNEATFVTSTQVLLHIPEGILQERICEIWRSLRSGGVFMATVHLYPLYGGLTPSPEAYEHLVYSPEDWEKFGSSIMYYQRLKAADYRRLLETAGFTIAEWEVTPGSTQDLAIVMSLPVHDCFSRYSPEELAARHVFFAAQKPR